MEVGQGDLLFYVQSGFTVGHCMQDYKCLWIYPFIALEKLCD